MQTLFKCLFFLIPFLSFGEELEVHLRTKTHKKPLYITNFYSKDPPSNWRYIDDLRSILEFDVKLGGFFSLVSPSEELENKFSWPFIKAHFPLEEMKERFISYALAVDASENCLKITAFHIFKQAAKTYPAIPISGNLDQDRLALHQFYDRLQKDLFEVEGIFSLKLLYAHRSVERWNLERTSEIWTCDADGANAKQVSFENNYSVSPLFFPSKGKEEFFYVSFRQGQSKIYKANLKDPTQKGHLFLSLRGNQALPAISPKGRELAFIADTAGRPDLFIQKLTSQGAPEGKPRQLFTYPRATQASPTFSPDGKKVAFVSDKDGPPRIYCLDVRDKKSTQKPKPMLLTKVCRENTCPSWSPDGKRLAFSGKIDGVRQVWIYDFSTEEEICLTQGPEMKENPCWAPDSIHLVYNTESEESCELFLLDIRDPNPIQVSSGPGHKRFPSWQARYMQIR